VTESLAESVDLAFADIAALAEQYRFRDCRHQGEPGCAVASGGIDEARLASYAKLQREAAHLERKQNRRAALEEKRRIRRIHRAMREESGVRNGNSKGDFRFSERGIGKLSV
jgi:ribosome biogenesis GTPase